MRISSITLLSLIAGAGITLMVSCSMADAPQRRLAISADNPNLSEAVLIKLAHLPAHAAIVYNHDGYIYTVDKDGGHPTQISFDKPEGGHWEHMAVSPDRRFVICNEQMPNPQSKPGGISALWLFDLQKGTKVQLLPGFDTAGNGGVDWDQNGFIYFAAKERDAVLDPKEPAVVRLARDRTTLKAVVGQHDASAAQDLPT